MKPQLYLASSSPRRRSLLDQIGIRYEVLSVNVEEQCNKDEAPEAFVSRMALEKARAGWIQVNDPDAPPVLGADTIIAINSEIMGKPADNEQASQMLQQLSGRSHEVLTAVALVAATEATCVSKSIVTFREIETSERQTYCAYGESMGKAGGYAIQGLAAVFIKRLEGSYSGVMGLPLYETAELLAEQGIDIM